MARTVVVFQADLTSESEVKEEEKMAESVTLHTK